MKTNQTKAIGSSSFTVRCSMFTFLLTVLWLPVQLNLRAQPVPHHFTGMTVLPDKTALLSLDPSSQHRHSLVEQEWFDRGRRIAQTTPVTLRPVCLSTESDGQV